MPAPLLWYVAGLALAQLALVVYAIHRREPPAERPLPEVDSGGAAPDRPTEDGEVTCRDCGAVNDADFRFCRRCVRELPGPPGRGGDARGFGASTR